MANTTDGLQPEVVDVFLSTQDQIPGPHTISTGRITNLVNGQVRHYAGQGSGQERVVVDQRNGFNNLTNTARNVDGTGTVTVPVSSPELLRGLENQLVSVSNTVPRVYAGLTPGWAAYPNNRYLSQQLDESVMHTTDNVLEVPSGVTAGDACGFVWTDTSYDQTGQPIQATFFAIKSVSLGTWILTPQTLFQSASNSYFARAQVVTDGIDFWVFWNSTGPDLINVQVFDQTGTSLATSSVTKTWTSTSPGYWDVTFQGSKILLCQPGGNSTAGSEVHIKLSKFTLSGTISVTENVDTTMTCQGPVMWVTNDNDSTRAYLASYGTGSPGKVFGYAVNVSTLVSSASYPTNTSPTAIPDAFAGWTVPDGGNFDMFIAWTTLAQAQSTGPKFDPAFRQTIVYQVPFGASFGSHIRTNNSVCLISRAFRIDGSYYANTYYQSGSGQVLAQAPATVSTTSSDVFIGNGSQTVPIAAGDFCTGAPFTAIGQTTFSSQPPVIVSNGFTATVASGDTVTAITSSGLTGIVDGTPLLKWHLTGFTGTWTPLFTNMSISGTTGVPGVTGVYYVVATDVAPVNFYTTANQTTGAMPSGTFGAGGTATGTSMTVYSTVQNKALSNDQIQGFYTAGQIVVTGSGTADGTKTVDHLLRGSAPMWQPGIPDRYFVIHSTETFSVSIFSATVSPANVGEWHIAAGSELNSSDTGSLLTVSGSGTFSNDGTFTITSALADAVFTANADAAALQPLILGSPPPTMTINLVATQQPYMFTIASITTDYTYYNALVEITNSLVAANNGVYKIVWLDPTNLHRFQATPTNGQTNQVNQTFGSPTVVTIVKATQVQPELQPAWYVTPLDNNRQPQAGCYERGLAYADWKIEGDPAGPDLFPCALSNAFQLDNSGTGLGWLLPFRAKAVNAGQQITVGSNLTETAQETTVGLKLFKLLTATGLATEAFQELIMPGPMAGGFTSSGFQEQGMLMGPETPFLVSESNDTGTFGMAPGTIQVQAVWEATDDNGERVWSYPSPVMQFVLQNGNNTAVYGGRSPLPFQSDGTLAAGVYGLSNRVHITLSLYRTATVNGIPTTQLYKITNDLNPNGLYTSGVGSGFTFPNLFTWNYRDQSIDTGIINQEQLYTSTGALPRFPGPPSQQGCVWQNRTWLTGYDGAAWMSGEKQEGDANWFFPGYRIQAGNDEIKFCQAMEQYLVLGAEQRMWYIPAQRFPDNTGSGGSLPTPSQLPFANGAAGPSATITDGVAYASTAGGVWLITRDLKNVWLSEPVKNSLVGTITDLAVDVNQRLAVANGTNQIHIYDPIPRVWYIWQVPNPVVRLTTWLGSFTYQDASSVMQQTPGLYADFIASGTVPYCPDITLALLLFVQARAVKQCWGLQLVGVFQGPHNLNASVSYPDDPSFPTTNFGPFTPSSLVPYVYEINPAIEEASSYLVRVFGTPTATGNSFSLELISAEVGIDRSQGTFKVPPSSRIPHT